jgi:hypothetical protein
MPKEGNGNRTAGRVSSRKNERSRQSPQWLMATVRRRPRRKDTGLLSRRFDGSRSLTIKRARVRIARDGG